MPDNLLSHCPSSPNCVCSEYPESSSFIRPVRFSGPPANAWARAITSVKKMGGQIRLEKKGYIHATFTSPIFRFVDDLELRLAEQENVLHVRSASRTGYYDFGVNRRRVERFRRYFQPLS